MRRHILLMGALAGLGLAACGAPAVAPDAPIKPPADRAVVQTVARQASPGASAAVSSSAPASTAEALPASSAAAAASQAEALPASSAAAPASQAEALPASSAAAAASASAPPSAAAPAVPIVTQLPAAFRLGPLQYIRQTLNNCGPASIAEVLNFWGVPRTQGQTMGVLRPDANSRGMMPYPVPGYIHTLGMSSLMGVGGTDAMLKALVANGFPVIVAQPVSLQEPVGHYREIEGYDNNRQVFVSTDTYLGPNHEISYAEFDQLWNRDHMSNQRFMVVYPPDKQAKLDAVLASVNWNKAAAYQADLQRQDHRPAVQPAGPGFGAQFTGLNKAWDYIQLGQLDQAKAAIASAPNTGRAQQMIAWLNQALALASAG